MFYYNGNDQLIIKYKVQIIWYVRQIFTNKFFVIDKFTNFSNIQNNEGLKLTNLNLSI